MIRIVQNKGFEIYFNSSKQTYSVYKSGVLVIDNKYKYSDVKSYVD